MSDKRSTSIGVYIIETLAISDEDAVTSEGSMIYQILSLAHVDCMYKYVRTIQEFKYFLEEFRKSRYRYLHISCHGSADRIATTLEEIPFDELTKILKSCYLDNRRLFLSACLAANEHLARLILNETQCYSVIGHGEEVRMDAAAIFWSSFYFAMLADNQTKLRRKEIKSVLRHCSQLYKLPVKYFTEDLNGAIRMVTIKNGKEIIDDKL